MTLLQLFAMLVMLTIIQWWCKQAWPFNFAQECKYVCRHVPLRRGPPSKGKKNHLWNLWSNDRLTYIKYCWYIFVLYLKTGRNVIIIFFFPNICGGCMEARRGEGGGWHLDYKFHSNHNGNYMGSENGTWCRTQASRENRITHSFWKYSKWDFDFISSAVFTIHIYPRQHCMNK